VHNFHEATMRPAHCILLSVLLCLLGCSSLEPQIGPQLLYRDLQVQRSRLSLIHAPDTTVPRPLTATVEPFTLLQEASDRELIEAAVTRQLVNRWSGDRVFLRTMFSGDDRDGSCEPELAVTGSISYLLVSGGKGTTAVALQLQIHDRWTGKLLWSMEHAGSVTAGQDQDYILVLTKPRPVLDPVAMVTDALARDMGDVIREWSWAGEPPLTVEALHLEQEPGLWGKISRRLSPKAKN
jgi:hypothetical protein